MARKMRKFASAGSIGRKASENVSKALAGISADTKPDMKGGDEALKAAVAPKKAQSFGEAFRAARNDPEAMKRGTFTWAGKSFSTKMAGEGASKPSPKASAPAAKASAPAAKASAAPTLSASSSKFLSKLPLVPKKEESAAKPATTARDNTREGRQARMGQAMSAILGAPGRLATSIYTGVPSGKAAPKGAAAPNVDRAARLAKLKTAAEAPGASSYAKSQYKFYRDNPTAMKKGGKVMPAKKYAKGGSIDGCAIRGKTRAPMKKGK